MNPVESYYLRQATGGLSHFSGPSEQQGHGIGGLFSSLFRAAVPLFRKATPVLKSAAKAVAKEAARTGVDVLNDVVDGEKLSDAIAKRGSQGAERIVKRGARKLQRMMTSSKTIKRRRKAPRDIFAT